MGGLIFRKDSFITHRAFCDALAEESARLSMINSTNSQLLNLHPQNPSSFFPAFSTQNHQSLQHHHHFPPNPPSHISLTSWDSPQNPNPNQNPLPIKPETHHLQIPPPPISSSPSFFQEQPSQPQPPPPPPQQKNLLTSPFQNLHVSTQPTSTSAHLSATALLQKAATVGATANITFTGSSQSHMSRLHMAELGSFSQVGAGISPDYLGFASGNLATWQKSDRLTRDFLGLAGESGADGGGGGGGGGSGSDGAVNVSMNMRDVLQYTGGVEFQPYDRDHTMLKAHGFEAWGDC